LNTKKPLKGIIAIPLSGSYFVYNLLNLPKLPYPPPKMHNKVLEATYEASKMHILYVWNEQIIL